MTLYIARLSGLQFVQDGDFLSIAIRTSTTWGNHLKGFEITIDLVDKGAGTHVSGLGGSYTDADWSGVSPSLDDTLPYKAAGTNLASTLSGDIELGEMKLAVVGSGVILISGDILAMITCMNGLDCDDAANRRYKNNYRRYHTGCTVTTSAACELLPCPHLFQINLALKPIAAKGEKPDR